MCSYHNKINFKKFLEQKQERQEHYLRSSWRMDLPLTKMGRGWGWGQIKDSASATLSFTCLLMSRALVLATEYVEPEVQEEKTKLEVEM